jgi:hypothetical protein
MDERDTALYVFRKLVYVVYLEIGALQPRNHPQVAEKAKLNTAFFQRDKERQAASLYHQTETETDPEKILAPYVERTGLRLEDVQRAFTEGDWRNRYGSYNFGGPKWAKIADVTQAMRLSIEAGDWEEVANQVQEVKGLRTNQGYLVSAFERTERRRK